MPDGREERGWLDADGRARVASITPGPIEVRFLAWAAPELEEVAAETEAPSEGEHWIELELYDAAGEPAFGQPYVAHLAGGEVARGRLGRDGRARVYTADSGPCEVEFPGFDAHELMTRESFEAAQEAARAAKKHVVEVELTDAEGRPAAGRAFRLLDLAGNLLAAGRLSPFGHASVTVPEEADYHVVFPDLFVEDLERA
jgi:hypothetical protein